MFIRSFKNEESSKFRFDQADLHDKNCFRLIETYKIYTYQDTIFENL